MKFKDKYTNKNEAGKINITDEGFMLGEMLELLIDKLERVRISWLGR